MLKFLVSDDSIDRRIVNSINHQPISPLVSSTVKDNQDTTTSNILAEDMWNIPIVEGTDSENELSIPVFHIHCLNENISL